MENKYRFNLYHFFDGRWYCDHTYKSRDEINEALESFRSGGYALSALLVINMETGRPEPTQEVTTTIFTIR